MSLLNEQTQTRKPLGSPTKWFCVSAFKVKSFEIKEESKMINRRQFLETTAALIGSSPVCSALAQQKEAAEVFFTKEISPQSLIKMFKLVGGNLDGKIAIKLHTGEPHGPNIIPPSWVQKLQEQIPNSTIVECNVL